MTAQRSMADVMRDRARVMRPAWVRQGRGWVVRPALSLDEAVALFPWQARESAGQEHAPGCRCCVCADRVERQGGGSR